jgi:hypothetical protein
MKNYFLKAFYSHLAVITVGAMVIILLLDQLPIQKSLFEPGQVGTGTVLLALIISSLILAFIQTLWRVLQED